MNLFDSRFIGRFNVVYFPDSWRDEPLEAEQAERRAEESLSALGTVLQRVAPGRCSKAGLKPLERKLLEHAMQQGLGAPDFYAVRKICEMADWNSPALLYLLLCEQLACRSGSTFLSLNEASLKAKLDQFGLDPQSRDAVIEKIPRLLKECEPLFSRDPKKVAPFIFTDAGIYRQSHFIAERRAARVLEGLRATPWKTHQRLSHIFEAVTETQPLGTRPADEPGWQAISLAAEQQLAALVAVQSPFTVIAGGPGTGKTSIVVTILRILAGMGVKMEHVALAAPTGRAANRMGEAIRKGLASIRGGAPDALADLVPKTLHRLLSWSPSLRGFRYNDQNPLEATWFIVDEGSMVDLTLMESLLIALKPGARLILLGDAYQLPSVEAGAIFRDLTHGAAPAPDSNPVAAAQTLKNSNHPGRHVVRLTQSFRQKNDHGGGHILTTATRVNTGQDSALFHSEQPIRILQQDEKPPSEGVSLINPAIQDVGSLTGDLFSQYYQAYKAECSKFTLRDVNEDRETLSNIFETSEKLRILCLTHATRFGVDMFNKLLLDQFSRGTRGPHLPGLPWMVTRNDYRLGLYNGDISIGLLDTNQQYRLVFRDNGGFKTLPFDSVFGLEQAFAMTVHKSQGSETDHVVLVLPESENALCKREVIYTALTRAKKSVLIYGTPELLQCAVSKAMERLTGLAELLNQNKPDEDEWDVK